MKPRFSIIVPVYNRPDEVSDLVNSLLEQTSGNFELIVVEDGSTVPCREQVKAAMRRGLNARYFHKENEGRSIARNYGMERAEGEYFIFFDSDCVIPPEYFSKLEKELDKTPTDCYGGPDAAHSSFSATQRAINYTMTSFLTTGGIRGGKVSLEKFTPRTFNMGFHRRVYERVGGFREMFSEDIDMSTRIRQAGFSICLFQNPVWHKRRVDFRKFARQVYVFGMSRITLQQLYPGSLKLVHTAPAVFLLGSLLIIALSIFVSPWFLLIPGAYLLALFTGALIKERSLNVAVRTPAAALVQLWGYGFGFLKAVFTTYILGRGRNQEFEIKMRKGK